MKTSISFIGGGNMASALIAGIQRAGMLERLHVVDLNHAALENMAQQFAASTASEIDAQVVQEIIVLAVKPQNMREVAQTLAPLLAQVTHQPLVISIAAGILGTDLIRWLGGYSKLVRCMPNTPALIGKGITGMVAWPDVSLAQRQVADSVLQAVGSTLWLEQEAMLDAVTALSGSGPAYVFYFIEAMQEAAQKMGLTLEQGTRLALATFTGAAELAATSSDAVEVLRAKVTSKGGTTHAAISSMEAAHVKGAIVNAVLAAQARGQELGLQMSEGGCQRADGGGQMSEGG